MHFSKNTLKLLFWTFQMILSTFGFSPEIPFLRKLHKFQEYEWKMITKQSDIIDKTFGYLLRGEIWLDNLASKNEWYNYKSSSQRDPLSLSRVRGGWGRRVRAGWWPVAGPLGDGCWPRDRGPWVRGQASGDNLRAGRLPCDYASSDGRGFS